RFIVSELKKGFPEYGFIGEEYGARNADSEWCFCIDPIDGTTSYVHDYPLYCVSIGLLHNGESYAGVVYVPRLDELYYAEKGKGAFLNGNPIHVSACNTLETALGATGFACIRARRSRNNLEYFNKIVPHLQGVRRSGTAAFDMCQVAAGRIDGYWEFGLYLHDVAAGVIIAREAGAAVSDINGGNDYTVSMVCSAQGIHQILCDELQPGLS
ncbi:MAG: inositol monophosphatase, partial [Lentisphaeria bacterium]|nr:inositol monophosphatase [Lentisphaeria bacterium]